MRETIFYKFHGTGNDFILVDDRNNSFPVNKGLIMEICDRHFGIGADGLILLQGNNDYDFEMVYFNSDGQKSTMCGNGGRCIVAFADFLSLSGPEVDFIASDGVHQALILDKTGMEWQVKLKMSDVKKIKQEDETYLLDTGSPHIVIFNNNVGELDVYQNGYDIRFSKRFEKEGINVDFVQWVDDELFVRTYERGVERETLSCGTGVTASALAYAIKQGVNIGSIPIRTKGGRLKVSFQGDALGFSTIWLEGPAKFVFKGTINY